MSAPEMPERIWLIPDAGNDGETVWCDDPAPGAGMDPDDAVEYRRSDLCASDQQVRALVDAFEAGLKAATEIVADDRICEAILARDNPYSALAPTPQAEGQSHRSFPDAADGRPMPPMGEDLMAAGLSGEDARFVALQLAQNGLMLVPATPTAQEAVAWRCKDYADGWVLYGNKRQAECYQRLTGCLMEALYTHPPQPSETVADVHQRDLTRPIIGIENRTAQEVFDIMSDRIRAALRALKGGAHG